MQKAVWVLPFIPIFEVRELKLTGLSDFSIITWLVIGKAQASKFVGFIFLEPQKQRVVPTLWDIPPVGPGRFWAPFS